MTSRNSPSPLISSDDDHFHPSTSSATRFCGHCTSRPNLLFPEDCSDYSADWKSIAISSTSFLQSADDDGTLGVMQDVVADAGAGECPLKLAESSWPDHNDAGFLLISHVDNHLTRLAALCPYLTRQLHTHTDNQSVDSNLFQISNNLLPQQCS